MWRNWVWLLPIVMGTVTLSSILFQPVTFKVNYSPYPDWRHATVFYAGQPCERSESADGLTVTYDCAHIAVPPTE